MENTQKLTFRKATIDDARMLHEWRNDVETRMQSHNTDEVSWENHVAWLEKSLQNPNRFLMVVEFQGEPVGTVRLDIGEQRSELSWTVAPKARGQGFGTLMISEAVRYFNRPLRAEIKQGNNASKKIAENAGFSLDHEEGESTHWIYTP